MTRTLAKALSIPLGKKYSIEQNQKRIKNRRKVLHRRKSCIEDLCEVVGQKRKIPKYQGVWVGMEFISTTGRVETPENALILDRKIIRREAEIRGAVPVGETYTAANYNSPYVLLPNPIPGYVLLSLLGLVRRNPYMLEYSDAGAAKSNRLIVVCKSPRKRDFSVTESQRQLDDQYRGIRNAILTRAAKHKAETLLNDMGRIHFPKKKFFDLMWHQSVDVDYVISDKRMSTEKVENILSRRGVRKQDFKPGQAIAYTARSPFTQVYDGEIFKSPHLKKVSEWESKLRTA